MIFLKFADYVFYNYFGEMIPDDRTKNWYPVNNAGVMGTAATLYLLTVLIGPVVMKFFKPFELKKTIMVYNTIMISSNTYIFLLSATGGWFTHYKVLCQPMGSASDPQTHQMALAQYYYLLTKFAELLDTVFFILRKKDRQITFLHVYHHFAVLGMVWGATRYLPDGHGSLMTLVNSFIHIVMYTYYLLSQFGPSVQKYLSWKKYLTSMQLTQFAIVFLHSLWVLHPSCNYPKAMVTFLNVNVVLFVVLFSDFYKKNYSVKDDLKKTEKHLSTMCHPGVEHLKQK